MSPQLNHILSAQDNTIQSALSRGAASLPDSESPRLDAECLLAHVMNCNRSYFIAWPDKALSDEQRSRFEQLLRKRQQGEPVAYLLGSREFWSLDLAVSETTLIPRPETETLVQYILERFNGQQQLRVLDAGTGSGAIAIALASEQPGWDITACDIDPDSVLLASNNANRLGFSINFVTSDWFSRISDRDFDVIVSNPPYIADTDPHLQQGDLRFEPRRALASGPEGMDDIEQLCQQAPRHLASKGVLVVEHGYNQSAQVHACFSKHGYHNIEQHKDLAGHVRMTVGELK